LVTTYTLALSTAVPSPTRTVPRPRSRGDARGVSNEVSDRHDKSIIAYKFSARRRMSLDADEIAAGMLDADSIDSTTRARRSGSQGARPFRPRRTTPACASRS
jgi:hypothetical protein